MNQIPVTYLTKDTLSRNSSKKNIDSREGTELTIEGDDGGRTKVSGFHPLRRGTLEKRKSVD